MAETREHLRRPARPLGERLAAAPISWGACEVPGWGPMPASATVLSQMAALGLRGTELGPPGFLPADPQRLAEVLAGHHLRLVGSFTPLVLHDLDLTESLPAARAAIDLLAGAGGEVLVAAAVQDAEWSPPQALDDDGWRRLAAHASEVAALCAEHGITFALHPHVGTLIESGEAVARALRETDVGWCLDTGHLLIGGTDPATFAHEHGDRVVHVHLKDVDPTVAAELRAGRLTLLQATQRGLFTPLGRGAVDVEAVLDALSDHSYDGWLVLEQDTAVTADDPAVGASPVRDATESIAFLHPTTEETNR